MSSAVVSANGYVLSAAGNATAGWQPADRSYLDAGPERFVLAPAERVPGVAAAAVESPALDVFRRMGNARSPGAVPAPQADALTFTFNIIASDPGLPAQATLPLLQNVYPNSEPSLAARGSELMLLYVRDTGAANPVQFTEIAFTHFDGTNWSTPAAVAANPRGQFAPQVVFDGAGNAVAVWEQIKDAAFTGTDLTATAAQMEIMTARWNPATQAWTVAVALTNNAVLDHGSRLAGSLRTGT